MRPRFPRSRLVTTVFLAVAVTGLAGCGERESGDVRADRPLPVVAPRTIDAGTAAPGLTAEERRELTRQLEQAAAREIKAENVEAATAELEQEIHADIGHE